MEHLVEMGYSSDMATKALAAAGTIEEAIDYILAHQSSSSSSSPPSVNPSQHQATLNRFFSPKSSKSPIIKKQESPEMESPPLLKRKRPTMTPNVPLYDRMRPRVIDDIVGQDHLLGNNSVLRSAVYCNYLPSLILWGPPGTGKTSIAKAIINSSSSTRVTYKLVSLSAVNSCVKDLRDAFDEARKLKQNADVKTVLFVDEVHRFNKTQLDSFLPMIEDGSIVFMGATTENPSSNLITPLLSRCRLLTLKSLEPHHVAILLRKAVACSVNGLLKSVGNGVNAINVNDDVIDYLSYHCDGDARVALIALEISALTAADRLTRNENGVDSILLHVSINDAKEAMQSQHIAYDKNREKHYTLISALHESIKGNDADAAIYWLARMLEGGEEPLYIARKLIRFASEDVGMADPSAMIQTVSCYQACQFIGMPECGVNLAHCVVHLALAPKSKAVYQALGAAQKVIKESVGQNEGVPMHLRNASSKLMADLGYGRGYIYTPDNPSAKQLFLPPSLEGFNFLNSDR